MRKKSITALLILSIGFLIPEDVQMPVSGASDQDYNKDSFWFYPWGSSVTHKGVDIFSAKGTEICPTVSGVVLFSGTLNKGGESILILGPKWRLHYYAHLNKRLAGFLSYQASESVIGTVGDSGNANGKAPHLHYSIVTLIPYPWKIDSSRQGWKKMFFLNPIDFVY